MESDPLANAVNLGWSPNPTDLFGTSEHSTCSEMSISYPEWAYEQDQSDLESGFWVKQRNREILRAMRRLKLHEIVEVGAGTGAVCGFLQEEGIGVAAIEPLPAGARLIQSRGITVFCAQLESVRLPNNSIKAYGAFDVLEHISDPSHLLKEIYRTLEPGGYLLITVPCGKWLWSQLDESLGHFRRYSKRSLRQSVSDAGFVPVMSRYLFLSLVPLAYIGRAFPFRLGIRKSKVEVIAGIRKEIALKKLLNQLALVTLSLESAIGSRLGLPYGLTIMLAAQKPQI